MAGLLPCEPSPYGSLEGTYNVSDESSEEGGGRWYFSRKDIEEDSPSRRDGIGSRKETYLRKSYCTFLQDLGMRLIVPQLTIATAIVFCHRFFLHQSHAKNDRRTIATVCMFLAGKVEETPRPLKDVVLVSYEIIHKRDAAAVQRIRQKEVYEPQKELILLGERVVLATLGFDLNIHHPYKPLVEAIKKFEVADQNALAKVAWNFVNDGLRTSLCVQFKPHHVAAGAIFLAAKFLKVKLPHVWWQEFNVTPGQLEEISNQTLELYEQYEVPPSRASEAKGGARASEPPAALKSAANEQHITSYNSALRPAPLWPIPESRANHQNEHRHRYLTDKDSTFGHSPQDGNKNLDREKPKAAFERRKALGDTTFKMDLKDGLERELEDVEVPCNCDKTKCEQIMSKCSNSTEAIKGHSSGVDDIDTVDRGELELFDDGEKGYQSPSSGLCKRKRDSPLHNPMGGKHKQNHLFGK